MTPDRSQAEAYISALTGDPSTTVHWQFISDSRSVARVTADYFLPIAGIWRELSFQNPRGVGIFMMVNAGDGLARMADNVIGLRALFIDDDEGKLAPGDPRFAGLSPSFSVRSRRGFHHYWCLVAGHDLERFKSAQETLAAHFGTDASVKDLPRVMRVPGFFHMKDPTSPFMVEFIPGSGRQHTIDEVVGAYPVPPGWRPAKATAPRPRPRPRTPSPPGTAAPVLKAMRDLKLIRWAFECPEDVGYEAWRGIATNIAALAVDDPSVLDDALALFDEISAADEDRYSPTSVENTFRSALRSAESHGPMTYDALRTAGVPDEVCSGADVARAPVGVARALAARRSALVNRRVLGGGLLRR